MESLTSRSPSDSEDARLGHSLSAVSGAVVRTLARVKGAPCATSDVCRCRRERRGLLSVRASCLLQRRGSRSFAKAERRETDSSAISERKKGARPRRGAWLRLSHWLAVGARLRERKQQRRRACSGDAEFRRKLFAARQRSNSGKRSSSNNSPECNC